MKACFQIAECSLSYAKIGIRNGIRNTDKGKNNFAHDAFKRSDSLFRTWSYEKIKGTGNARSPSP